MPRPPKSAPKAPRVSLADETDEFIYAVCERFFSFMNPQKDRDPNEKKATHRPKGAAAVAESLAKQFNRTDLNREKIYPLLWEAMRRKFLIMNAPVENDLRARLIDKYALQDHLEQTGGDVAVVNVVGENASRHVSATAADRIITLIDKVQKEKEARLAAAGKDPAEARVHLGLGAGYTAKLLADRLTTRTSLQAPRLALHALTPGGFYVAEQQNSPTAYFLRFTENEKFPKVVCQGMFSPPVARAENYDQLMENPSLKSAFQRRDEIDVLITSLAAMEDEHGLVREYFAHLKNEGLIEEDVVKTLEDEGWVGDVLFQPFSNDRAIYPKTHRTVALFTLDELVEFARKPGKHVVLVGGPCNVCNASKTNALRPLLKEPSLRVWSQLIIDREAAAKLLEE